jgi:tetratricopeptide (TPR) repeat protein
MIATCSAALLAALAVMAPAPAPPPPTAQSLEATRALETRADFLPRSALIEVDGQVRGRGYVKLELGDGRRTFKVRVSAEGYQTEELVVEAARVVDRQFVLALRPVGFDRRIDTRDAASMALAASALWRAGRVDDAADYAEESLRTGNTALANRVLGDVWRKRGDRDQAVKYYAMYLSLMDDPPDAKEIRAWLMQDRPGDIVIPAEEGR